MKEMINSFLDLFGNSILIIALMLSSFLLLINIYHYQEVNYEYKSDILTSNQYLSFKNTVDKMEESVKKINTDAIKDQNKRMVLKTAEGKINKCLGILKESDYYNLQKANFKINDLYFLNEDLFSELHYQCLFMVNYNIYDSLEKYNIDSSNYDSIKKQVESNSDEISKYTEFIRDEMLQNSSYGYTTNITRSTIFNKMKYTTEVISFNYTNLVNSVESMIEWYVIESGGNYE